MYPPVVFVLEVVEAVEFEFEVVMFEAFKTVLPKVVVLGLEVVVVVEVDQEQEGELVEEEPNYLNKMQ